MNLPALADVPTLCWMSELISPGARRASDFFPSLRPRPRRAALQRRRRRRWFAKRLAVPSTGQNSCPRCRQRLLLRPRNIERPAHHEALGRKAAARLQRDDEVPAAIGIGRQIADQVVDAHALLDVDAWL